MHRSDRGGLLEAHAAAAKVRSSNARISSMSNRNAFSRTLVAEREAFARFLGLLEAESVSLIRGDIEELVQLAQVKSDQVAVLAEYARERSEFLASEGFRSDRIGMAEWLLVNGGKDGEQLSRLWHGLVHDASIARRVNEKNGVLIESRLRVNHAALNVLRSAMKQVPLYGPDGAPAFGESNRELGLA